jgi:hypothetical protein
MVGTAVTKMVADEGSNNMTTVSNFQAPANYSLYVPTFSCDMWSNLVRPPISVHVLQLNTLQQY